VPEAKPEVASAPGGGPAPIEKAAPAATPSPEVAAATEARPGPKEEPGPVAATKPADRKDLPASEAALAHTETPAPQVVAVSTDVAVKKAAPGTHVIAAGDMISGLAKRYGVSEKAILKANPGLKPGNLQLGKVIRLPAGAKAGAAADVVPAAQAATPEPRAEAKPAVTPEPRAESASEVESPPKAEPKPEPMAEVPASPAQEANASEPASGVTSVSSGAKVAPAQAGKPREHVLEFEDTLSGLAKRYGVTAAAIMKANPGLDPKKLKPGRKINIP
jgi:LysM repeat protein